ncbi:MAG: UDP-N-acetylmuramoyl-L-alanyl-D-glutamate--2,6-diaminopimelate ligase [Bacteroidia bacterium]|nr:UDP-N-acetylmuramoyl-L-alanyl-D-glutamate--2,6-diaminopimelate ligase [Bacteroidia bacterium]GIV22595.1 MAG: UDP-N-acetylmuramoyl-L-alanyl-D-glutamate--2,6-diaminopimelate ligase [Bacteroidia bacterium]
MKRLPELLEGLPGLKHAGPVPEIPIHGVTADSRTVQPGTLFVAWQGKSADGHAYLPDALHQGAVALLVEKPVEPPPDVPVFYTENARLSYAHLCQRWFDFPDKHLFCVGITGTNGKSSTAYYLYQLWQGLGYKTGLIGTVFCLCGEEVLPATLTTPDSYELYRLFRYFADRGVTHVAMEVSSIALDQYRTAGLTFQGAIFTNLSHDHLDYHGTFIAYRDAKKRLFDTLSAGSFALTNVDDKNGLFMLQNTAALRYGYSVQGIADFQLILRESGLWGIAYALIARLEGAHPKQSELPFTSKVENLHAALIGSFQAYNLLAATAAAFLGEKPEKNTEKQELWYRLAQLSTGLRTLPGRLEPIPLSGGRLGLVDYAHTPDAIEKVLRALRPLVPEGGKLIAVLGAGGNRDRTKRGPMAEAAARWADQVFLTSDNPRYEDPLAILEDMYAPLSPALREKVVRIPDRAEAIRTAVRLAPPHSLIAVLGKGHESYQEIQGVKHPFSDTEILLSYAEVDHA